jgi:hypothetical protein
MVSSTFTISRRVNRTDSVIFVYIVVTYGSRRKGSIKMDVVEGFSLLVYQSKQIYVVIDTASFVRILCYIKLTA